VRHDNDLHDTDPQEREISLGTATILGIFLALALVCAAFFGFGYSMGRHSNPLVAPDAKSDSKPDSKIDSPFSKFKSQSTADDADNAQADAPSPKAAHDVRPTDRVVVPQNAAKPANSASNVAFRLPTQPTAPPAAGPLPATGVAQPLVQVSATSRQGDAESLLAALRQKGYSATIRQEPQDKLYHVQLGPFANKKEADAMRQRLDTDGYKAIVK
jgi:DedD protein